MSASCRAWKDGRPSGRRRGSTSCWTSWGWALKRSADGGRTSCQEANVSALAIDPPVLLMDEPFGALDPLTRAELHTEFRRIQQRVRKSVVIVTHDMGEAFALGDRVGVLEGGRLIANDRPEVVAASREPLVRKLLDALPVMPHGPASDAGPQAEGGAGAAAAR